MSDTMEPGFRQATPAEVAAIVRMFREVHGWTQDTLAALSRLEVRTVQRVEAGHRSSQDTKRAIAGAFGLDDLDAFSKFRDGPSQEKAEEQRKDFERDHVMLDLTPATGRGILSILMELSDYSSLGHQGLAELPTAAQDAFAFVLDFARDCMDIRDVASKAEMLSYGDELQDGIDALNAAGQGLYSAKRTAKVVTQVAGAEPGPPMPLQILYLVTAPVGSAPGKVAVPKSVRGALG